MFLSQKHIILISPLSFSAKIPNGSQKSHSEIAEAILYAPMNHLSTFSYNYYISDITTQASLNMQLATARFKYKFVSFSQ